MKKVIEIPKNKKVDMFESYLTPEGNIEIIYQLKDKFEEGTVLTHKDREIIVLYKETALDGGIITYAGGTTNTNYFKIETGPGWGDIDEFRLATEKEKKYMFDFLRANGYQWNPIKKELEKIYIPKFGDIVKVVTNTKIFKRNYYISIYPNKVFNNKYDDDFYNIANLDLNGNFNKSCACDEGDIIIPATEEEKQELLNKIRENDYIWEDFELKIKPGYGHNYYYINSHGIISKDTFMNLAIDELRWQIGNCFLFREEAEPYVEKFLNIFK